MRQNPLSNFQNFIWISQEILQRNQVSFIPSFNVKFNNVIPFLLRVVHVFDTTAIFLNRRTIIMRINQGIWKTFQSVINKQLSIALNISFYIIFTEESFVIMFLLFDFLLYFSQLSKIFKTCGYLYKSNKQKNFHKLLTEILKFLD